MDDLVPPDTFYVSAARGWAELGNPAEAKLEMERLSPAAREHPMALETWWEIHAAERNWEAALESARELILSAPSLPSGWINQSYCLHELKRTVEARDCLLKVASCFPDVSTIPYNLACYACQLGDNALALRWVKAAAKVVGKETVKAMAKGDPDLAPLWKEIREL